MKKRFTNRSKAAGALAFMMAVAAGCGGGGGTSGDASGQSATPSPAPAAQGKIDPLGKYDPPIELTTVRTVAPTLKFENGDTIDNNIWYRAYETELGIKVKNTYSVNSAQAAEKMNVTIASGNIPDFMEVNQSELKRLVEADLIMDLTAVYKNYVSPLTKSTLEADGGLALKVGEFGGKLMGIPRSGVRLYDFVDVLWVRTDWLEKLKLPEPKTIDDLVKIAEAFTTRDPDGNGKPDTFGLGFSNELWSGVGSLNGFFNAFHAYPTIYTKDAAGKIAIGAVQPEAKAALAKLQEIYKAGLIDKEFGVKPSAKMQEDIAAGKIGMTFARMSLPLGALTELRKNDPKAEWKPFPIPSSDGKPAKAASNISGSTYFVVKKGIPHPEAVIKLMNLYTEKSWGASASQSRDFASKNGIETFVYAAVGATQSTKNLTAHLNIAEAVKANDPGKLNLEEQNYYEQYRKWKGGDPSGWAYSRVFGPEDSAYAVINGYKTNGLVLPNAYVGAPTQSLVEKGATLGKLQLETYTKIIMGTPIEEFDKYVGTYNSLGGAAIAKEIAEALK